MSTDFHLHDLAATIEQALLAHVLRIDPDDLNGDVVLTSCNVEGHSYALAETAADAARSWAAEMVGWEHSAGLFDVALSDDDEGGA